MGLLKIFGPKINIQDFDALVATEYSNCFIRVSGFKEDDPRYNTIFITQFTSHNNPEQVSWHWRLTRIWRIIRGDHDPDYEIFTPEVMDNFIKALQECREEIFGSQRANQS